MITYKRLTKIKAITFDLDDTLYDNMPYIYAAEASLLRYIDTHYSVASGLSSADWKHIKRNIIGQHPSLRHNLGRFRTAVLTQAFVHSGMPTGDIPLAVQDCFEHFYFKRSDFKVSPEVISLLDNLAGKVPLAAITNGNVNCDAIGIASYFTHIVHASSEYPMKPYRAIFDHTSTLLNIRPANILHVGDDLENDVKGAVQAGYQSAWYAFNRRMNIHKEPATLLPHVQLSSLHELQQLIS